MESLSSFFGVGRVMLKPRAFSQSFLASGFRSPP